MYTLRKKHGKDDTSVLTVMDSSTYRILEQIKSPILSESAPVIVDIPPEYNQMQKSRYLKTRLREIVQGDFLFIDGDTLIADRLDEIDRMDQNTDIAAVSDGHEETRNVGAIDKMPEKCRKAGFSNLDNEHCFNSGVLFVRDTPVAHDFFRTWHDCWKQSLANGVHFDQPAMWEANRIMGHPVQEFSGVWNCQFYTKKRENYNRYVKESKILHYYRTFYHGRLLLSIIDQVSKTGKVNFKSAVFLQWPRTIVYIMHLSMFKAKLRDSFISGIRSHRK